jgi:hypothetical protein
VHFERALSGAVDVPFLVFFGITAALAIGLARLPATRRGLVWLQSPPP